MNKLLFLVLVAIWVLSVSNSKIKYSHRSMGKYPNNAEQDSLEANYETLRIGFNTVFESIYRHHRMCSHIYRKEDFEKLNTFCVSTLVHIDRGIKAGTITSETFASLPNIERIKRYLHLNYEPNTDCAHFEDDPVFFPFMENYLDTLADLTNIAFNKVDPMYEHFEHEEL